MTYTGELQQYHHNIKKCAQAIYFQGNLWVSANDNLPILLALKNHNNEDWLWQIVNDMQVTLYPWLNSYILQIYEKTIVFLWKP